MAVAEPGALRVEVCCSLGPRQVWRWQGELPAGTTLAEALRASALLAQHPEVEGWALAVWGKPRLPTDRLRDRDRLEVLRPLRVDPKEARRLRYRRHLERFGAAPSGSRKR